MTMYKYGGLDEVRRDHGHRAGWMAHESRHLFSVEPVGVVDAYPVLCPIANASHAVMYVIMPCQSTPQAP